MAERRPLIARRLRPGHWVAVDAFAAVALAAGFSVPAVLVPEPAGMSPYAAVPTIALACLPLAGRRRWPVPVCALVLVAAVFASFVGWEEAFVPLAVALHAVALLEARRTAVAALVAALAVTASGAAIDSPSWTEAASACGFAWLVLGLAWAIGLAVREQRAYAEQAVARSAQAAATAERLRMARDVHDVVAHSMSLISMRAGIANHVAATHPEEAGEALAIIEETSRKAQADLRRLLGLLRDASGDQDGPPYTLDSLRELVAAIPAGDVRVELDVEPGLALGDEAALVVYRLVQESLTNVLKHAGPARCRVAVGTHAERELVVEVVDDGGGGAPREGGHGLAGLEERVTLYGGTFSAGPEPGGGFAVRAKLLSPGGSGEDER
ncbi:two-component sensor histidine kinase [Microtetraspora sp. AC03309]|uniref:sensor histidine kinase n=1 Tax=Microtetraspora sp. AC03309 TaxID=2779376 RepID=UPI001E47DAD8|nr:histidine kinase [Microtetraspora sp. AC03309]MCC5581921.1 two-component sensor histidine kinase [Microtetraspora sp. AC03309]